MACVSCKSEKTEGENPFFSAWETPYGVPPFDKIRAEHFLPALERGMSLHDAEIDAIASKYGSQFVVAAIDAKKIDGIWRVTTHGGKRATERELFEWAREVADRGAGEILFTSMDHDGTRNGYPCDLFARLAELPVPVIASGGAGKLEHFYDVLTLGHADAVLAASVFHYGQFTVRQVKEYLQSRGVEVRF